MSSKPSKIPARRVGAAGSAADTTSSKPQWSTVLSDGVLALATLIACSQLHETASSFRFTERGSVIRQWQLLASFALLLTGLAASAGCFRFAGVVAARGTHDFLTSVSMFFSMPLLGLVACLAFTGAAVTDSIPVLSIVALIAGFLLFTSSATSARVAGHKAEYTLATSLFGVLCVMFRAAGMLLGHGGSGSAAGRTAAISGVVGAGLVLLSGAVGATGVLQIGSFKLRKVDIFHYVLATANVCIVWFFSGMWD